ncbi:hypothetical protein PYCC9005_003475 [Savitreella phatthalungensis]
MPSTTELALPCAVTAIASSLATYLILRTLQTPLAAAASPSSATIDDESDDDEPSSVHLNLPNEENKLIYVVRGDLGMTKGKIAAQCGHATLACYKKAARKYPELVRKYEREGQTKIALKAPAGGEQELELLQAQAMSLGLIAEIIHDAGRTQIAAGSATVLGIGPGPKTLIDQVTGKLSLL